VFEEDHTATERFVRVFSGRYKPYLTTLRRIS
jgi:hypothetical protein